MYMKLQYYRSLFINIQHENTEQQTVNNTPKASKILKQTNTFEKTYIAKPAL